MVFILVKFNSLVKLLSVIFGWTKTKIQNINTVHVIDMIDNVKIFKISNPKILGAPGASCGRFSITYSRLRFLFPFGGQMGFSKWLIMTHFSHPGKKYNRSCLLSLENNSRHANEGARTTFGFESLKMFTCSNRKVNRFSTSTTRSVKMKTVWFSFTALKFIASYSKAKAIWN